MFWCFIVKERRQSSKRQLAARLTCCRHMIFTFSAEWIKWSTSNINNASNSIYILKSQLKTTLPLALGTDDWYQDFVNKLEEIAQPCMSSITCHPYPPPFLTRIIFILTKEKKNNLYISDKVNCFRLFSETHVGELEMGLSWSIWIHILNVYLKWI